MARSPLTVAVRATFACAGTDGGSVSNAFNFSWAHTGTPVSTDWDNLMNDVIEFYTGITSTSFAVENWMGAAISNASHASEIALYQLDMADPHHYYGSPVSVKPWTIATVYANNSLPNEVCLALSYRAAYGTDPEHSGTTRPRASDRGRAYIGPLSASALHMTTLADGRKYAQCDPIAVETISQAATDYLGIQAATDGWTWCVWSRKEAALKAVVDKAVDADFDSQRRRGAGLPLQTWVPL